MQILDLILEPRTEAQTVTEALENINNNVGSLFSNEMIIVCLVVIIVIAISIVILKNNKKKNAMEV